MNKKLVKSEKLRSIGIKMVIFFIIAIAIPTIVISVFSIRRSQNAMIDNMKLTSQQTLKETQKGFSTYLKTLSQPIDLLTRKNEIKHMEETGDLDTNITTIEDALVASVKVTTGAQRCYFATKTGYLIKGWTKTEDGKVNPVNTVQTGVDSSQKNWYKGSIGQVARNGIYATFTDPYTDSETGGTIFSVSQEIKATDKSTYGAVGMDIDFSQVEQYVQNIGLLNTGFVLLVDSQGNVLVNNDKNTFTGSTVSNFSFWTEANADASAEGEEASDIKSYTEKINGETVQVSVMKDEVTGWNSVFL